MRTKTRVNELEYDLAQAVGRISKLEWAFAELMPRPKSKDVKKPQPTVKSALKTKKGIK